MESFFTGLLANIITIIVVFLGVHLNKKKDIELQLRERKIVVYKKFIDYLFVKVFSSVKRNKQLSEKDMENFMIEFQKDVIFWGSDEFIRKFGKWRNNYKKEDDIQGFLYFEELLRAIRRDTGHKNSNFEEYELLKLFVNDLEESIQKN